MTQFLGKVGLFVGSSLVILGALILAYIKVNRISSKDIPAPNLTISYSYNEKLSFIVKDTVKPDILAIGSSMCLDNLNSDVVTSRLSSTSYLNASSWGMSPKDDYELLKILLTKSIPSTLILVSSIVDFQTEDKNVNCSLIKDFLADDTNRWLFHLKTYSTRYYITNFKYAKLVRTDVNGYETLGFDRFGGIALSSAITPSIDKWNHNIFNRRIHKEQYAYLDSIASVCKAKKIRLLVFQSPLRWGLMSKASSAEKQILAKHLSKTNDIFSRYGAQVVNANTVAWNDSLFVDANHLKAAGSSVFTSYCFDKLDELIPKYATNSQ